MNEKKNVPPNNSRTKPEKGKKPAEPAPLFQGSFLLRCLHYFKPYIGTIIILFFCYLAIGALNLVWPYLNGTILYDSILSRNEDFLKILNLPGGEFATALLLVVLTMVLVKLTSTALTCVQSILTSRIGPDIIAAVKSDVFDSMGKLSLNFYYNSETGGLMTRVLSDADRITSFFIDILPNLCVNIFTLIATCIIMFTLNPLLAVVSLCLLPVLFWFTSSLMPRLFHMFGRRHRAERNMNSLLNDNITGARVVRAFGQEGTELKRFAVHNKRVRDAELYVVGFDNRFQALYTFVENAASLLVWAFGAFLILHFHQIQVGLLITFAGYANQLKEPLEIFSQAFRSWSDTKNSGQRIFAIIDAKPEIIEKENPQDLADLKGDLEVRNLTFSYLPGLPVLKDISFSVKAGKMLGIVGRSGAGKTTLVSLLARLYDPDTGEILLDGINIKDLSLNTLRKNIAMVSQETYIFMGTVAENIAYARPEATREEIIQAAISASAHDFICRMPDGYDTFIGSSGRSLSGGERQRLSIARAILADPKILILDEATASLDTETEKNIQESLNQLVKNRTTLSIAHRLSTLRDADGLIVLDHGMVTESGTHQELIEKHGTFYMLMELQTKALAMKGLDT